MNLYFKPMDDFNYGTLKRIPAFSYERLADCVLGGIIKELAKQGYTEEMIEVFITSKIMRCELDGWFEDVLEKAGKKLANKVGDSYKSDCAKWAEEV